MLRRFVVSIFENRRMVEWCRTTLTDSGVTTTTHASLKDALRSLSAGNRGERRFPGSIVGRHVAAGEAHH